MESTIKQQRMDILQVGSLRSLVEQVNTLGVQRDDIVTIIPKDGSYFLVYFK